MAADGGHTSSYESLAPTYPIWVHLSAGALAGMAEHCATFPIDSVKTRQQSLAECPEVRKGRTPIHGMANIARREGWGRLLRGINVVMLGAIPAHALYFTVYEKTKSLLTGNVRSHSNTFQYITAGTVASIVHDLVMNPAEVVKQRMQMKNSPYCGSFQCIRCIYRNEGLAAFYRSYTTQLSMNVPFQAVQFATYENIQQVLNPNAQYDPKSHLIAGAVAGGLAAVVTTPWDCVKTVINTQQAPQMAEVSDYRAMLLRPSGNHYGRVELGLFSFFTLALSPRPTALGVLSAISTIYQARGLLGFTYGMQARVMQAVPSIALSWSVYELFKYVIGDGAGFRT